MTSVDTNPPRPPRPSQHPSMHKAQSVADAKSAGYSLDLESVNFEDPFGEREDKSVRRRSMTLDSSRRQSYKRSATQPHIIDSSNGSPKLSKNDKVNTTTQEKPKPSPLSSRPGRPPPPSFKRSASQPQVSKNGVAGAPGTSGNEPVVLRKRPPSADSADGRGRTPPPALQRLSSPVGSRESSPLSNVPENESSQFNFSPTQPARSLSPTTAQTSPPATPTKPPGPPRPLPSQLPPRPARPRSGRTTPTSPKSPPISPTSSKSQLDTASPTSSAPISDSTSNAAAPRDLLSPQSISPTPCATSPPFKPLPSRSRSSTSPSFMTERQPPEDEDGGNRLSTAKIKSGSADTNVASSSPPPPANTDMPAVPPRPFMPPRPFPPNSKHGPRSNKPSQPRRESAPPGVIRSTHKKPGDKNSPSGPKRNTTRHKPSPRHPPRPSPNSSLGPKAKDVGRKSPQLKFTSEDDAEQTTKASQANSGGRARETDKDRLSAERHVEEDVKKKRKFVSFRSTDSIVHVPPLDGEDNFEGPSPPPEAPPSTSPPPFPPSRVEMDSASPKKGRRRIMNSVRKTFHSLRKKKKSPPSSPQDRRRSDSDAVRAAGSSMAAMADDNYPDPLPQGIIDPIVVQCVAYLNKECVLLEQGLFRVPGDLAAIKKLRLEFMRGNEVNLHEILDPHTVAGLLKLHFRELKTSLIPRGPILTTIMEFVRSRDVDGVCAELGELDVVVMSTLSIVMEMLTKVTTHSSTNMMTIGTLATSCGPSMFPYLPPSSAVQITSFLIENCHEIFHPHAEPAKKDKLLKDVHEEEEERELEDEFDEFGEDEEEGNY